ncbi:hypothetical protein K0H71_00015 [Bacillus sp. IITD106]|nr:hypothetical protein [Bacillus sp. IITD106]
MSDKEKSVDELLLEFAKLNRKSNKKPRKLKSVGFGNLLLDPDNPDELSGMKTMKHTT